MVLLASSASALAQAPPQDAQAPAAPAQPHRVMPRPTNLQVLPKDISTEDLIKLMRGYAGALGVHCNFCHEVNEQTHHTDFAADTKPEKASARTMILMTREINDKYLPQIHDPDTPPEVKVVTCGTCHRGMTTPEPFTPKPESKQPTPHSANGPGA
jgi:thioredoxin reductase